MFRRSVLSSDSGDSDEPEETKPIFTTIKSGDDDAVRQFIRENPNIVNHRSGVSDMPVSHYIADHGSAKMFPHYAFGLLRPISLNGVLKIL